MKEVKDEIKRQILQENYITEKYNEDAILEVINNKLLEYPEYIPIRDKRRIRREIYNSLRRFDILSELLEDDEISDIMVNGYNDIYIERKGILSKCSYVFESKEKLEDIIQQIVSLHNRIVNESNPIVDVRMPDGSRVNIVLPPIAINGPILTIRKFPKQDYSMDKFEQIGTITAEAGNFLKKLVIAKYNIFISGGTGSGKTTFLNVLSNYIPHEERIITIEDSAELRIQGIENIVRLETRNANIEGKNEITMKDLIKSSLRMRPSRIIVGEVRGDEVLDMLQAMNTGHDGSLSTGHANSSQDMIGRLETLVLSAKEFPLQAIKRQIASAIDIIVHLGRLRDGTRHVLEISEILYEDDDIKLNKLYEYIISSHNGNEDKNLIYTGNKMKNTNKLIKAGFGGECF